MAMCSAALPLRHGFGFAQLPDLLPPFVTTVLVTRDNALELQWSEGVSRDPASALPFEVWSIGGSASVLSYTLEGTDAAPRVYPVYDSTPSGEELVFIRVLAGSCVHLNLQVAGQKDL